MRFRSNAARLAATVVATGLGLVTLVACSNGEERPSGVQVVSPPASGDDVQPGSSPSPQATVSPVVPSGRIPRTARPLAADLTKTELALFPALDSWQEGGSRKPAAQLALRQQKIYRLLVRKPALARRVVDQLSSGIARRVARHIVVAAAIRKGVEPIKPPVRLRTKQPLPVNRLRRFYETAARRFGLNWEVLAAINFVETRFGRLVGPSSAGALGPMQFLPSTWEQYGAGGDIFDPRDSIFAAGRFLAAHGASLRLRSSLLAYNNSDAYADAVQLYAREMRKDERRLYAYYLWQVFVITTEGDLQLTGPGCCNR